MHHALYASCMYVYEISCCVLDAAAVITLMSWGASPLGVTLTTPFASSYLISMYLQCTYSMYIIYIGWSWYDEAPGWMLFPLGRSTHHINAG